MTQFRPPPDLITDIEEIRRQVKTLATFRRHTHAGGGGASSHGELTGVTANQHHNRLHGLHDDNAHDVEGTPNNQDFLRYNASTGKWFFHGGLHPHSDHSNIGPNDHHDRDHASRHAPGGADGVATGTPVLVLPDGTPAGGSGGTFARNDHQHGIDTHSSAPIDVEVTAPNAGTSGAAPARGDHRHKHGVIESGNLHPEYANGGGGVEADEDLIDTAQSGGASFPSYGNLSTVGPEVTIDVPASGRVMVHIYCRISNASAGNNGIYGFEVSGENSISPILSYSIRHRFASEVNFGASFLLVGLNPGETTFTAKYSRTGSGNPEFNNRRIAVVGVP